MNIFTKAAITAVAVFLSMPATAADNAAAWRQAAIEKVAAQRTTPRSAQLRGSKGTVRMEVAVDGGGMITDYHMIQSSGAPILDREADLILMRVGSFTIPPNRAPMRFIIPIRW